MTSSASGTCWIQLLRQCRSPMGRTVAILKPITCSPSHMLALSIVKSIEIIGEAASGVSSDFWKLYPDIPWQDIVAMRNRLVHVYFDIDLDRVWDTMLEDLPKLAADLSRVLAGLAG